MTKIALILVEGAINMLRHVQAAKQLGLYPIILSADPTRYDYLVTEGVEVVRVDTTNLGALINECSRLSATYDIAGITSAVESSYATAGKLSRYFKLPGPNPTSIERCCDKIMQRQLLAEAGVPIPAFRVATDAADVESAAAEMGLPVIVKPAVGSGSCGVRLCRNVNELAEHTAHLLGGKHIWPSLPRILVEEFAQGPHYCIDIIGNEVIGISVLDFCRPPHFVYRELSCPAVLTKDEHHRIANVSLSCLRALGLGWGPTNVELRWTQGGPVVIEVNPRLPGSPAPELIQLAYGVDLVTEHIKLVIGDERNIHRSDWQTAVARWLVADRDGILNWIRGDSQAAAVSGVAEVKFYFEPKRSIVRRGDYRDCIGHVIAASSSLTRSKAILQRAVDLIDWSIT